MACPDPAVPETAEHTEPAPFDFELPEGMRVYTIVLLRRGPTWSNETSPEAMAIGAGHMSYNHDMTEAGKLTVAGPFLSQEDSDDYAGIYIYDTSTLEETKELVAKDPAVRARRFVPEYLVWLTAEGLQVNSLTLGTTKSADRGQR